MQSEKLEPPLRESGDTRRPCETEFVIERLDPADYAKCGDIWDMQKQARQAREWYAQIVSGNRQVYVCREGDAFIAEGALVLDNGDRDYTIPGRRVYLSRLIVRPGRRGQGIGARLLDFLIGRAREMGFEKISVGVDTVNTSARRLYERKGSTQVLFEGEDELGKFVKLLRRL